MRDPFVFKFSRSFGILNGLMPGIGEGVPISIAMEQVVTPLAGIATNGKTRCRTQLSSPDKVLGLVCAAVT